MKELNKNNWNPEIEIVRLGVVDIVATSGLLDEDELPPWIINERTQ